MWKALSVFAALLAAGAAFLSFLNKTDLEKEEGLLVTAQQNQKDIDVRFAEVKDAQTVADRRTQKMEERREEALGAQEEAKNRLAAKEQEVEDAKARTKELEEEIAKMKADIAEIGRVEELVAVIEQLNSDLFAAKNEVATLNSRLNASSSRAEITAKSIQAAKDLESRQRNGEMLSTSANIASVYNTWGFVVLDQGDRQGIVSRTKLDVKRGGEVIAKLVVTNLEKNRSVCDIVPGSMEPGQMLRPGDSVSVSAESLPKPIAEVDPNAPVPVTLPGDLTAPGAGLPAAEPAPAAPTPAPAPEGVPAGEVDPFGDLDAPTTPSTPAAEPAPVEDDPFGDL